VVLDLYNRKAIGGALSADMGTVHTAVPALPFGQGGTVLREGFPRNASGTMPPVRRSMSRKGNCRDNACAESFFKALKREPETLDGKHSAGEVRQSVFMCLEAYCNRVRGL
jgi:hypothetical protein